jgi:hypothetical protein
MNIAFAGKARAFRDTSRYYVTARAAYHVPRETIALLGLSWAIRFKERIA